MQDSSLIPHLFRTEYSKIVAVLCRLFGIRNIEIAEDIVSDTFLMASETWGLKGTPENPAAWLYTVAKNKTKDYLKRNTLFTEKIELNIIQAQPVSQEIDLDFSDENITDSQLRMIFAICHPSLTAEAQVGLALRILCGFGIEEIADAFLSNKETINKRLFRAKEKLRTENVKVEFPDSATVKNRLQNVLLTLYLLFNEGYYSTSANIILRKDLCLEAMRLNYLLLENKQFNLPEVNALFSLMCFHASRFEARIDQAGQFILYEDQDRNLWNTELIEKGNHYLNQSARGNKISKYHLEAVIAYWHTQKEDVNEKWENILQMYNKLLQIDYSPVAALNRTYALYKVEGWSVAIKEAEKINLKDNHFYHVLLAHLYANEDVNKAIVHLKTALKIVKRPTDNHYILELLNKLTPNGSS